MYEGTENLYEVGYKKVEMAVETRQKRWQYQYMLMARGEISPSPCRKNCRQVDGDCPAYGAGRCGIIKGGMERTQQAL